MKKVLFASTALVASASIASADVALSGSAEMGIIGGDARETQFWNDVDVSFTLSGETDNGLSFGTKVDLDEAGGLGAEEDNIGVAVFLSGDFGTLTLGDTDGALDFVMQDASAAGNAGSIDDSETGHAGYNGGFGDGFRIIDPGADGIVNDDPATAADETADNTNYQDNQVLRYDYSFGDFAVAISHEQAGLSDTGVVTAASGDGNTAIGVRYSGSFGSVDVTAGLGYQMIDGEIESPGADVTIIGVSALVETAGGFSVALGYSDWDGFNQAQNLVGNGLSDSHSYIGVGYSFDAFAVHANYGEYDSGNSGFGVAASYDLGGGASLHAAYGASDPGDSTWSFGVAMSF